MTLYNFFHNTLHHYKLSPPTHTSLVPTRGNVQVNYQVLQQVANAQYITFDCLMTYDDLLIKPRSNTTSLAVARGKGVRLAPHKL